MTERCIFITGASGYVGRNLVRYFTDQGLAVIGLTRSAHGADVIQRAGGRPVIGDIRDSDLVGLMQGANELIHAAADLDHGSVSASLTRTNVDGTRRVFHAALQCGMTVAVHVSTDSVLQDGHPLVNVNETAPLPKHPAGPYSASKAMAEVIAKEACGDVLRVVILRPRFVWGRDDGTALPQLVAAVQSGRFAWISGGGYRSSTTHIDNLCHGVDLALTRGRKGEIYFITDGPARRFRETVEGLLRTQNLTIPEKSVPRGFLWLLARGSDRLARLTGGRVRGLLSFQEYATSAVEISLDIAKAQGELGYHPVVSWEDGLHDLEERTTV